MSLSFNLQPDLGNDLVHLLPLGEHHFDALYQVASDPQVWLQHQHKNRYESDQFKKFFQDALESGRALVVMSKSDDQIIGSSRYEPCPERSLSVEIGWSFLGRKYWGGQYNRAVKTLMIDHAFRHYDEIIFQINRNNLRSQKATMKLGGVLKSSFLPGDVRPKTESNLVFSLRKDHWNR